VRYIPSPSAFWHTYTPAKHFLWYRIIFNIPGRPTFIDAQFGWDNCSEHGDAISRSLSADIHHTITTITRATPGSFGSMTWWPSEGYMRRRNDWKTGKRKKEIEQFSNTAQKGQYTKLKRRAKVRKEWQCLAGSHTCILADYLPSMKPLLNSGTKNWSTDQGDKTGAVILKLVSSSNDNGFSNSATVRLSSKLDSVHWFSHWRCRGRLTKKCRTFSFFVPGDLDL